MANELYPDEHGRIVRVVVEDTYNDGSTVPDANTQHVPSASTFNSYDRSMASRGSNSAFLDGSKPTRGPAMGMFTHVATVDHISLDGTTNVDSNASFANIPSWFAWACCCGFVWTYAEDADYSGLKPPKVTLSGGNNDRILKATYRPRSSAGLSSVRVRCELIADGAAEGELHDLRGARADWTLNLNDDGTLQLSLNGKSLAYKPSKVTSPTLSALPDETEVIAQGGAISLTKVEATAVTYGKASETTEGMGQLAIRKLSIKGNNAVQERTAPTGTEGIVGIRHNGKTPEVTFELDMVTWPDDFDIYTFMDDRKILRLRVALPSQDNATDFMYLLMECFITKLTPGMENGYRTMQVTAKLGWPDSSGDGGGLFSTTLLEIGHVTVVSV